MRVVVLGGTSLTGPFVVRRLYELGHEITVFHRGTHATDFPPGIRELCGDFAYLPDALRHVEPDLAIHMWAMDESAARRFLDFFRGSAGRVIVISSGDVYRAYGRLQRLEPGPPDPLPLAENAPLRETLYPYRNTVKDDSPEWVRQYDKILVERAFLDQSDIPSTVIRYPAVYGPNDKYHRFREWLKQMVQGDVVEMQDTYASWRWTHGYVEDVAESVVLAAMNPSAAGKVYNVGEENPPTMQKRAEELARVAGWNGRVVLSPKQEMPQDFSHHLVVDTTKIRRELGYREIVGREEGLARTIAWEHGGIGAGGAS